MRARVAVLPECIARQHSEHAQQSVTRCASTEHITMQHQVVDLRQHWESQATVIVPQAQRQSIEFRTQYRQPQHYMPRAVETMQPQVVQQNRENKARVVVRRSGEVMISQPRLVRYVDCPRTLPCRYELPCMPLLPPWHLQVLNWCTMNLISARVRSCVLTLTSMKSLHARHSTAVSTFG